MVLWLFRKHEIISNGSLIDARGFPSLLLLGPSFLAEWRHKWRPYTLQCDWPTPRRFSFGTFSKTSRAAPAIFLLFSLRTWNQFQKLGILFGRSQGSLTFSKHWWRSIKKICGPSAFRHLWAKVSKVNRPKWWGSIHTHQLCITKKWNKNPRCKMEQKS